MKQVIQMRHEQAEQVGLSPDIAEAIWRAMIDAFIQLETEVNRTK